MLLFLTQYLYQATVLDPIVLDIPSLAAGEGVSNTIPEGPILVDLLASRKRNHSTDRFA